MLPWVTIKVKSKHILHNFPSALLLLKNLEGDGIFAIIIIRRKHIMKCLSSQFWQHGVVETGSLGWKKNIHTYTPLACSQKDHPNCSLEAYQKTLDLPQSTSQTCAVPMITLGSQHIFLPHHVLFWTLYKNMEAIQSNPYVTTLEPPTLWSFLDSVVRNIINFIPLPL